MLELSLRITTVLPSSTPETAETLSTISCRNAFMSRSLTGIVRPAPNPLKGMDVRPLHNCSTLLVCPMGESSKAVRTPFAKPSSTISINMPHATAMPVSMVRNLLVRMVCNISLKRSNIVKITFRTVDNQEC